MKKKRKRNKNKGDKFLNKYYVISSVFREGIPENVFGFKVERCQRITKHRYLLKLYRCDNIEQKQQKDEGIYWRSSNNHFSFYSELKEEKETGLFPISFADFISLVNHYTNEVDKKDIVKIQLKGKHEISKTGRSIQDRI